MRNTAAAAIEVCYLRPDYNHHHHLKSQYDEAAPMASREISVQKQYILYLFQMVRYQISI